MIPVIDFNSETVLDEIREAYTTVGFAVFTNTLNQQDQQTMKHWFDYMKQFFELTWILKEQYSLSSRKQSRIQCYGCRKCRPNCS